ncbi:MAG: GIY-YIG nuclease family protein [Bacteroidetes bacterium]|nr:GIY-YIG nuclease family protein [Bacteroidota bacterium]MCW5896238.1 GIY-YIG nuclease family protein [Bacteroidota bacterium]
MAYHVYILFSRLHERTYVGQTEDLENRVRHHNAGRVRSTKAYRPWEVLHSESYSTRAEAMQREQWYKSPQGRRALKELLSRAIASSGLSVPFDGQAQERDGISSRKA